MATDVYDAADGGAALVTELPSALSRPVMELSRLLWQATAIDNAISAGSLARPHVLTCRQSALLGVIVRVLPRWVMAPGTRSALPLPPPQCLGPDGGCLVVGALAAGDSAFLSRSVQQRRRAV